MTGKVVGMMTKPACALRWARRPLGIALSVSLAGLVLSLVLVGVSAAAPSDLPGTVLFDPTVASIVSQVATPTLKYELEGLTGECPITVAGSLHTMLTRNTYSTTYISLATRYAYEKFAGYGLVVTYHNYVWTDTWGQRHDLRNVVAEKPGLVAPDEVYLITAHVDDLPTGPRAPGADDNGSGSVAVLMAARLLAPHHFAHTIRFVLFTGEEQGLRGSYAYAADCKARGDDIRGVVNLDMIAYNSDEEPALDLYAHTDVPASLELTRIFSAVVGLYGLDLAPSRFADIWPINASDQWSFLKQRYPAFLAIEDMDDFTPYYHKTTDALLTLDLDYYADFTRAAIATVAHLGGLLPAGHVSGTVYALDTGLPLLATVHAVAPAYQYTFTSPTDAGGTYSLHLPTGSHTLTVRSLFPGYFPATVTDVSVIADGITVRDVALEPWPRLYLPWVVHTWIAYEG